jgi:hypothetical protein
VTNYVKSTNFAVKDSLTTGDPAKKVKGTEIDVEFNNIASAISSKLDQSADISITGRFSTSQAGTVSAPSYSLSTDTNTGIYFSAADEISLAAGGYQMTRVVNTGSSTRYTDFRCNLRTAADVEATLEAGRYSSVDGGSTITTYGGSTFLRVEVEDTPRMYIMDTGRVGIGTGIPNAMLHVATTGNETMLLADNGTATAYYVTYASGETAFASNPASGQLMAVGTANDRSLRFVTNSAERIRVTNGGEVYIAGTTDQGSYNLQVNGTGVWGAGAYVNGSDARLKENIKTLDSGLDVVSKINPVTFTYRQDTGYTTDTKVHTGFIAQELQAALAETNYVDGIVNEGGPYLSVAYQSLIPVLTKAIQELKAELDTVKAELATLKGN